MAPSSTAKKRLPRDAAVAVPHTGVPPCCRTRDLPVTALLTGNGRPHPG